MAKIFVFNPDHEIALASNNCKYNPKRNILRIIDDLSILPVWFCSGCSIEHSSTNSEWSQTASSMGLQYDVCDKIDYPALTDIDAWGWNKSLVTSLTERGVNRELLPDDTRLTTIRRLTERRTAVDAMEWLLSSLCEFELPTPPVIITKQAEIDDFTNKYSEVVFKSPLSESGRGVRFASAQTINDNLRGWLRRTIEHQGYVIAEERYSVLQNFAMEFHTTHDSTTFDGYSLFETDGMAYTGNTLMPDNEIEAHISSMIGVELLNAVKNQLIIFIQKNIAPHYNGHLGVDMFVFGQNSKTLLHPCVEINLRPTMGLVANIFYKNFVKAGKRGLFTVDFYRHSDELLADHIRRKANKPLIIENRLITNGYLSLCPIGGQTQYRVRVEVYP